MSGVSDSSSRSFDRELGKERVIERRRILRDSRAVL